jgi:hypothetical protein
MEELVARPTSVRMAARPVHVRLRADIDQLVAELAEREGNTASAVVRRLISEALRAAGDDVHPDREPTVATAEGRGE